ncbi:MAG: helix-turn-helix transcriptional regulator [Clostridia bacterium]|nr:helix-turn-helix transcriptional regulator [Clostridia bacterium]
MISEFLVLFERGITESVPKGPNLDFCANFPRGNFAISLDFKRFAEDNGYDYDRFRKLFKLQFGLAPKQFVIEQWLKKAYTLVTETKETCTDIAYFCGFSDQAQFSKMFRRRFRYSPEEVRRQLKTDK